MVNHCIFIGNLGHDPELRYTQGGTAVCNFSIATSRKWKEKTGETKEETEWIKCVAWGRTAEALKEYCSKGKQLFVQGRLQTREWEDRDGNKRFTTEVVVETVKFLGGGGRTERKAETGNTQAPPDETPPPDDQIPF
jgi:single-strand DNA-binding protein